jgi:hypothetical protein
MQSPQTSDNAAPSLVGLECCHHEFVANLNTCEFMEEKSPLTLPPLVLLATLQPDKLDRFTKPTTWRSVGSASETIPPNSDIPVFISSLLM